MRTFFLLLVTAIGLMVLAPTLFKKTPLALTEESCPSVAQEMLGHLPIQDAAYRNICDCAVRREISSIGHSASHAERDMALSILKCGKHVVEAAMEQLMRERHGPFLRREGWSEADINTFSRCIGIGYYQASLSATDSGAPNRDAVVEHWAACKRAARPGVRRQ